MTSAPYDTNQTHSVCLCHLRENFEKKLYRLTIHYARSYDLIKLHSWEVVKGVLHAAMGTVELTLKADGFCSRDPSIVIPKTSVSVGGHVL